MANTFNVRNLYIVNIGLVEKKEKRKYTISKSKTIIAEEHYVDKEMRQARYYIDALRRTRYDFFMDDRYLLRNYVGVYMAFSPEPLSIRYNKDKISREEIEKIEEILNTEPVEKPEIEDGVMLLLQQLVDKTSLINDKNKRDDFLERILALLNYYSENIENLKESDTIFRQKLTEDCITQIVDLEFSINEVLGNNNIRSDYRALERYINRVKNDWK